MHKKHRAYHEGCVFCHYSKNNPPGQINDENVFMSTDLIVGFLDIQPLVTSQAHILLIPRRHFSQMNEMENDEQSAAAIGVALSKVSSALLQVLGATSYNIVQNNGASAGQVVFHVHFHIVVRPRDSSEETERVRELLTNGPENGEWTLKDRMSYSAQVFARGRREDLDIDWCNSLVPQLRRVVSAKL